MVDKSKRIYGWWTTVDYEVHCCCGNHIQNCEDGESTRTCDNCGQKWKYNLMVEMVDDE